MSLTSIMSSIGQNSDKQKLSLSENHFSNESNERQLEELVCFESIIIIIIIFKINFVIKYCRV